VPKTTENFRVLSVEKKYVKSEFDKVIPGLMI
jgi:cyclophilin family peptidyl-prolyl cis-trans isomerase